MCVQMQKGLQNIDDFKPNFQLIFKILTLYG
jgi:hypothetical protein